MLSRRSAPSVVPEVVRVQTSTGFHLALDKLAPNLERRGPTRTLEIQPTQARKSYPSIVFPRRTLPAKLRCSIARIIGPLSGPPPAELGGLNSRFLPFRAHKPNQGPTGPLELFHQPQQTHPRCFCISRGRAITEYEGNNRPTEYRG